MGKQQDRGDAYGPCFRAACLALTASIAIAGCDDDISYSDAESSQDFAESTSISTWTDDDTGCQYLIYSKEFVYGGMGGLTPRMNADGTQMCAEPPQ